MLIILTGGGTLGSVTPLLATVPEILKLRPETRFVWFGTEAGPERALVVKAGIDFLAIPSGKLRRYFSWSNFTDLFRIAGGVLRSWRLLVRMRPDLVVSAGGFVAVPVVWAAWLCRVPVHIHQMDIRPGLANRLSAPFAASMSAAFEKSRLDYARHRPVVIGNPVRSWLLDVSPLSAKRFFGFRPDLPVVAVLGGGTGAETLNNLVVRSLPLLAGKVQVFHQTGAGKAVKVDEPPSGYVQVELVTEEMRQVYGAADLVVTRAGMGTLTEVAAAGLPVVIVPLPGTHQEENAAFFFREGSAEVLSERTLISKALAETVLKLVGDPARLAAMAAAMRRVNPSDAAARLAKIVVRTAEQRKGASGTGAGQPSAGQAGGAGLFPQAPLR